MSELLSANRAKDPLEVMQSRLFDRKAPPNAVLIPERKIPSLALDLGAIIDEMLMTDTIGGEAESTGQALPGMAMPFGKATKLKGTWKKITDNFVGKVRDLREKIIDAFPERLGDVNITRRDLLQNLYGTMSKIEKIGNVPTSQQLSRQWLWRDLSKDKKNITDDFVSKKLKYLEGEGSDTKGLAKRAMERDSEIRDISPKALFDDFDRIRKHHKDTDNRISNREAITFIFESIKKGDIKALKTYGFDNLSIKRYQNFLENKGISALIDVENKGNKFNKEQLNIIDDVMRLGDEMEMTAQDMANVQIINRPPEMHGPKFDKAVLDEQIKINKKADIDRQENKKIIQFRDAIKRRTTKDE